MPRLYPHLPRALRCVRRTGAALAVALAVTGPGGCVTGGAGGRYVPPPPPAAYPDPPHFAGVWLGEVAGQMGELDVEPLGSGRYYGSFISDDEVLKFVLNMKQRSVGDDGEPVLSNLVEFEWQDGHRDDQCERTGCGEGKGWVLINPEDTALSGMIGFGDSNANRGPLSFVRVDDLEE